MVLQGREQALSIAGINTLAYGRAGMRYLRPYTGLSVLDSVVGLETPRPVIIILPPTHRWHIRPENRSHEKRSIA